MDRINCLDKGFIELEDHLASDLAVVNAARVSVHKESAAFDDADEGLIKFLMKNHHGTPFEHGYLRFRVKAPIFVFREWHRHRVGHSYNEWSARYSELAPEFYIPPEGTVLTQVGKPGHYTYTELDTEKADVFRRRLEEGCKVAYACYIEAIEMGVARQQARLFLPVNTYSEMIWSVNPRSLMHFLSLRDSEFAQAEIREYASAVNLFFHEVMPVTAAAFIDYGRKVP